MAATENFFRLVNSPLRFRLFLLSKLPAAFVAGIRIKEANEEKCAVAVPYCWATQNPFGSTYFACLSMAAEMSTGVLAMAHVYKRKPPVSMLVVGMECKFYKKATGNTVFCCNDGQAVKEAVQKAVQTREAQAITVKSVGYNGQNEAVAAFLITWSFKAKQ